MSISSRPGPAIWFSSPVVRFLDGGRTLVRVVNTAPGPTDQYMSVKLNRRAYDYAGKLVQEGRVVLDDRDAWSEHQPSAADENQFIEEHGWDEYAKWHLGVDDEHKANAKGHYKFPYGDFRDVHRCAVLSAESRAGQYKHDDIKQAAAHLHGMLEGRGATSR
jgi:hypothetical protein